MKYFVLFFFVLSVNHAIAKGCGGHGGGGHGGCGKGGHGSRGGHSSHGVYDNNPEYSLSAKFIPLNGYIVYDKDTLTGLIILNNLSVSLGKSANNKDENGHKYFYNDRLLKSVVVYGKNQELFLTRINSGDKTLSRVLHFGRLRIFDDRYCFISPDNIDKGRMKVAFDDQFKTVGSFVSLDTRYPLIKSVNKIYGLHLKTSEYSWDHLYSYITMLD